MKVNYKKIDKGIRANITNEQLKVLSNIDFHSFVIDYLADTHEGFKSILKLYEKLEPYWVNIHNREEQKKPQNVQNLIEPSTTIQDIIEEADGDEITELSLSVVGANRIAHFSTRAMKRLIEIIADRKKFYCSFDDANRLLLRYFDSSNVNDEKKLAKLKSEIDFLGIEFTEQEANTFRMLSDAQTMAFQVKDHSLYKMLTILRENEDINYGLFLDEKGKEAFAMDLPYYGQYSVHIKKPRFERSLTDYGIREYKEEPEKKESDNMDINNVRIGIYSFLKDKPYDGDLYEKETIMLTSAISNSADSFSKSLRKLSNDKERIEAIDRERKDNPRYAHYLKVKNGYDTRGNNNGYRI